MAGFAAAALVALVVLAHGASEAAPGPDRGEFTVAARGIRSDGRFLGADRATGTLTHTVGPCALAHARWSARRAG